MRRILEELYHGNLSVDERTIQAGSKYARALASVQLANVSMVEDFITGFRMGAQIMMAVLLPDGQSPEQIGKASQDE